MPSVRGLRKLKLPRVDLVPKGSNPKAHIALFKEAPDEGPESNNTPNLQDEATTSPEETNDMSQTETPTPETTEAHAEATTEVETNETETVETTEAEATETTTETTSEAAPEPVLAGVEKADVENIRKELSDAQATIAKMEADARHREFIAKASDMELPGDHSKWATLLEKLDAALEPSEFGSIETLLKGARNQGATAELFKQFAKGDAEADTPAERLEKAAAKRVEEGLAATTEIAKEYILRTDTELAAAVAERS